MIGLIIRHLLSASSSSPLTKHCTAISYFPPPSDKPAFQRFLGMLNFYRKFPSGLAGVLAPLTDALRGPGKSLSWSQALDSTFPYVKDLLTSIPELVHPRPDAPISLAVDASDFHWVLCCSSSWMAPGPPWLSSPRSNWILNGSTPPLTKSFLPPTLLSGISVSC